MNERQSAPDCFVPMFILGRCALYVLDVVVPRSECCNRGLAHSPGPFVLHAATDIAPFAAPGCAGACGGKAGDTRRAGTWLPSECSW